MGRACVSFFFFPRQVCKLRELPIFTFVNKMDRPSLSPFELLDQIEREFGMQMAPVLWPIGDGERFKVCVLVCVIARRRE